ncbi:MAG: galactosyltransferase-related protein [Planctomycetota bacterium]
MSIHLILNTHTPDRLARTILGLANQTRPADSVTVTCDGDAKDLYDAVAKAHADTQLPITLIRRGKVTPDRLGQVRNNAVRQLIASNAIDAADGLIFLDGDVVPAPDFVERHARCLTQGELTLARRFELTEAQTNAFDDNALRNKRWPVEITPDQHDAIRKREARYRRQLFMKRLGLGKPHKPKILGGNFSTTFNIFNAINGMDETFSGWGTEDDDFARRAYAAGARPVIALSRIAAFHQYHPTRAPGKHRDSDNHDRIKQGKVPPRCERGLENPMDQPRIVVDTFGRAMGNEQ